MPGIFGDGFKALRLPESDGLLVLLLAGKGEVIVALSCHGSTDIREDLGADALPLQMAVHHKPANEGIVLFGIAGDQIQNGDQLLLLVIEADEMLVSDGGALWDPADG